jgi:hypothetical protein
MRLVWVLILLALLVGLAAGLLAGIFMPKEEAPPEKPEVEFELESPAFQAGGTIPVKYSCEGVDLSPPLEWRGVPAGTAVLVLIMDDPDAPGGTFTHWLLYNIPATLRVLPEGVPAEAETPYGFQGVNDFGRVGYGGPCPPQGETHTYRFILYALDVSLDLPGGATLQELNAVMEGHIIATTRLEARFGR